MLRKTGTKFKKPAQSDIHAKASISLEEKEKFTQQFAKKGRATITVFVEVADDNGIVTMTGDYEWFVQRI